MKCDRGIACTVLGLALGAAVFAFDIYRPIGLATSLGYVALIFLSWASLRPTLPIWLGGWATVLLAIGHFLPLPGEGSAALPDRALTLIAIWLAALLCRQHILTASRLGNARDDLESQRALFAASADRNETARRTERADRRRAEAEIRQIEHRFHGFFNQTFQFAAILDAAGEVSEINETLRRAVGLTQLQSNGRMIWELPIWAVDERDELRRAVKGVARGDFYRNEFQVARGDGETIVVDLSLKPIRNADGAVDLIILEARDVTQRKREQMLLLQAQKMEVLGQFAGGIAHDFNNLLTIVAGNLELLERRLDGNPDAMRRIGKAVEAVFQGRKLTNRMLTFARKQELAPTSVALEPLIAEATDLARSGLDQNTRIETDIASDIRSCWADPAQLETALFNLMINARDAMPDGGRIVVRAYNYTADPDDRGPSGELPGGEYVVVAVEDEGEGIPEDIRESVTDPFFTTKPPGQGSGLGLSMVAGFVSQSNGHLEIESTEGAGTTIRLFLPRASRPVETARTPRDSTFAHGEGRILVVEDDPEVRDAVVSMLKELGYGVEYASSGDDGLALLRQGRNFDLLVTDLQMPGEWDGAALAREARALLPELKVLYSSARPEAGAACRGSDAGQDFLSKPYHYGELAQRAARLLNGKGKAPHAADRQ